MKKNLAEYSIKIKRLLNDKCNRKGLADYLYRLSLGYKQHDMAHNVDHCYDVVSRAVETAEGMEVDIDLVLAAAVCHDIGIPEGRDKHHIHSKNRVLKDNTLKNIFNPIEIDIIAEACEDHRSSGKSAARTEYGMIVSDADKSWDFDNTITRCIQFRMKKDGTIPGDTLHETIKHIKEKYDKNGYARKKFYYRDITKGKDGETSKKFEKFANDLRFAEKEYKRIKETYIK